MTAELKQRIFILVALVAATSLVFLDQTILPVALPTIQKEFLLTHTQMQWAINAYMLSTTVFLIAGGRLSDMFGHKRFFCLGMGGFMLASMLCGLSPSGHVLIAFRFLQGMAAAMLMPTIYAIILEAFPPNKRGGAIGVQIGISSLFLCLGPFLGGIITQYWSWRFIFFLNVPVALIGLGFAAYAFPPSKRRRESFDIWGFVLLTTALSSVVYALMHSSDWGWASVRFWVLLAFGAAVFALLYIVSKWSAHPLCDFSLFRRKLFLKASIIVFTVQFALGITIYWPIFLQKVVQLSPSIAGSISLFSTLPVLVCSPIAGKLTDKYGQRLPATIGFAFLLLSFLWLFFALPSYNVVYILMGMFLFGIGVPFTLTPTGITGIGGVPSEKRGNATGIYNTMRNGGGSVGIAILGSIIAIGQKLFTQSVGVSPQLLLGVYNHKPDALAAFANYSPETQRFMLDTLNHATAMGYNIAALLIVVVLIAGLITLRLNIKQN